MFEYDRLIVPAMVLAAVSGVPGLLFHRRSTVAQGIATIFMVLSGIAVLIGAASSFGRPDTILVHVSVCRCPDAAFVLSADSLSLFFLAPIALISALGSLYGVEYWNPNEHPDNARKLRLFYGLLSACLMIVVLAKNSVTFLFGWEGMAVSAFFLVGTEDERSDVREAAWIYLAASHAGTLAAVHHVWSDVRRDGQL